MYGDDDPKDKANPLYDDALDASNPNNFAQYANVEEEIVIRR